jgi:hypothetical protein
VFGAVTERAGPTWGDTYRNNKKAIVLLVLVVGLLGAIGVRFGMRIFSIAGERKKLNALALERADRNRDVTYGLGKPLEIGWFGKVQIMVADHGRGTARFELPLSGPKASGTLSATAVRRDGTWEFATLTAEIPGRSAPVDLLGAP